MATDVADDVVHVGVTLHGHQLIDHHGAGQADAAQGVALQVDQHHVLGTLLRVADQLLDARGIVIAFKPRTGTGNRPGLRVAGVHRHQPFRRGTDHVAAMRAEQAGEWCRVGAAQLRIQRLRTDRRGEPGAPAP
ncbi:hypothetical protein G6F63_015495 [Rhizopus arrhizus]|nr:hypothetical protein G6F63_015495 [Rhizopus arrhizus]